MCTTKIYIDHQCTYPEAAHQNEMTTSLPPFPCKMYDAHPPSPSFPVARLPLELQLRVLRFCLITNKPIIDFASSLFSTRRRTRSSRRLTSQNETLLAVLSTCRLYRAEGWRILLQNNPFVYTSDGGTIHQLTWTSALQTRLCSSLRNLTLRYNYSTDRCWELEPILYITKHIDNFPHLAILALDLIQIDTRKRRDIDVQKLYPLLKDSNWFCLGFRQDIRDGGPPRIGRCLDELTITGLNPGDDISYLTIKIASTLLKPGARMGLDWTIHKSESLSEEKPRVRDLVDEGVVKFQWIVMEGVDSWVESQRLSLDRQVPDRNVIAGSPRGWQDFCLRGDGGDDMLFLEWVRLVRMAEESQDFWVDGGGVTYI